MQYRGHQALSEFANALDELTQQGLLDPAALEKAGLTLLARSTSLGYGCGVVRLSEAPGAGKVLEMPDENGLAPYQHPNIALRRTRH